MSNQQDARTPMEFSVEALRKAVLRIGDGSDALHNHRRFIEEGGEIRWVVDNDVVNLFLNPKDKASYADVFPIRGAQSPSPSLIGLAALLADFLFSKRFGLVWSGAHPEQPKILLEPHTDELDGNIREIVRKVREDERRAGGAVGGGLEKRIRTLLHSFVSGKEGDMSNEQFVEKLLKTIEHGVGLILPEGKFQELKRARDLLKERKAIAYQADIADLQAAISDDLFEDAVADRSEIWLGRIRHLSGREDRSLGDFRDAMVLAKLECLNRDQAVTRIRYVMITGTGHLHFLVNDPARRRTAPALYLVRPSAFLGSPHLFEMEGAEAIAKDHDSHWKRLTQAVNLLGTKFNADSEDVRERVSDLLRDWETLQRMALPFLPAQSAEVSLRKIANDILRGKPMDALETQLYIALSDFFVVTAELGLLGYQDRAPTGLSKRKPPPLRLAFYPKAEEFIRALIKRSVWDEVGGVRAPELTMLIDAVKAEQKKGMGDGNDSSNFNYPLLLCLASRFAVLDDWHATRVLSAHAGAVANVTEDSLPFVTGREAALLESYSRRLDAGSSQDLRRARESLEVFRKAVEKEQVAWADAKHKRTQEEKCQLLEFNPDEEFALHELRADVDNLVIDFTEQMFNCFGPKDTYERKLSSIRERKEEFTAMTDRSESCLARLEGLDVFRHVRVGDEDGTLAAINKFLRGQLELCALQCVIFLAAAECKLNDPDQYWRWRDSDVWERVEDHDTVIAKIAAQVARCIWSVTDERKAVVNSLETLEDGHLLPYDLPRREFLIQFSKRLSS